MNREAAALGTPAYTTFSDGSELSTNRSSATARLRALALSRGALDLRKRGTVRPERVRRDPRRDPRLLRARAAHRPGGSRSTPSPFNGGDKGGSTPPADFAAASRDRLATLRLRPRATTTAGLQDATPVAHRRRRNHGHAAPDCGGGARTATSSNRSPTGSPSTDHLPRDRRPLREPRDIARTVPASSRDGPRRQRLHERDGLRLSLNHHSAGVLGRADAIPSEANYQRFCSNFLATKEHGLRARRCSSRTRRRPTSSTAPASRGRRAPPARRAGRRCRRARRPERRVPVDLRHGATQPREQRCDPGIRHPVVLSGDDTFTRPRLAAVPLHGCDAADAVWNDEGDALGVPSPTTPTHERLRRPSRAATGIVSGGSSRCPGDRERATRPASRTGRTRTTSSSSSGSRTSRTTGTTPNVVYFADTGEPRALPEPCRLARGRAGTTGRTNGRIFKLVLDPRPAGREPLDPDRRRRRGAATTPPNVIHQPDNVETTDGQPADHRGPRQPQPG